MPKRSKQAMSAYNRQLIATEEIVIKTPGTVVRHPPTNITEEGHSKSIKLVWPMRSTPATPNQNNANMVPETIPPTTIPTRTTRFIVIAIESQPAAKSSFLALAFLSAEPKAALSLGE